MTWTAIDLLEKIVEFIGMTSDENNWDEQKLADDKSRLIRLQRIKSLLSAFGIVDQNSQKGRILQGNAKEEIQSFICRDFIEEKDFSDYKTVIPIIEKYDHFEKSKFGNEELKYFYGHLIQYKKAVVMGVLNFNSGLLEAPIGIIAAYQLTEDFNRKMIFQ